MMLFKGMMIYCLIGFVFYVIAFIICYYKWTTDTRFHENFELAYGSLEGPEEEESWKAFIEGILLVSIGWPITIPRLLIGFAALNEKD